VIERAGASRSSFPPRVQYSDAIILGFGWRVGKHTPIANSGLALSPVPPAAACRSPWPTWRETGSPLIIKAAVNSTGGTLGLPVSYWS